MKKIITLFLFLSTTNSLLYSNDVYISNINSQVKFINSSLTNYKTSKIKIMGESAELGLGTAYYDKDEIKFVEIVWYGEFGKNQKQYYFSNSKLVFVLDSESVYNRPVYWNKEKSEINKDTAVFDINLTKYVVNKYYFKNSKVVNWLKDDMSVQKTQHNYQNKSDDILKYINKKMKLFDSNFRHSK